MNNYSTLTSVDFGLGCSFVFILISNIPFWYLTFAEFVFNSMSNGNSLWYFFSTCSELMTTVFQEIFTLISSFVTPGISAVTTYVISCSLNVVSTKGSLISLSTTAFLLGFTFPNSLM